MRAIFVLFANSLPKKYPHQEVLFGAISRGAHWFSHSLFWKVAAQIEKLLYEFGSKHLKGYFIGGLFFELNFSPQNNSWLFLQTGPNGVFIFNTICILLFYENARPEAGRKVLRSGGLNLSKSLCSLHHHVLISASPCLQSISSGFTSESLPVKHRQRISSKQGV